MFPELTDESLGAFSTVNGSIPIESVKLSWAGFCTPIVTFYISLHFLSVRSTAAQTEKPPIGTK